MRLGARVGVGARTAWCSLTRESVLKSKSNRLRPMHRIVGSERRRVPIGGGEMDGGREDEVEG